MRGDSDLSNRGPRACVARMTPPAVVTPFSSSRSGWLAVACLFLAVALVYGPALSAPFIFDDHQVITENASIRRLATAFSPPANGSGVTGRPLVNASFALNHALAGEDVRLYHVTNFLIHALAACALLGVMRRMLARPVWPEGVRSAAGSLALLAAFAWAVHPLQTESVTCVAQRTESLAGLFFLATFYGFLRATAPDAKPGWRWFALAACYAGVATKEVMVAAPVLLLLFDRTFVAGSWREAWARRRGLHLGLFASWLPLAWLVLSQQGTRGGTDGAALGPTVWAYGLTQCRALALYLQLAAWPHPLVLDYDQALVREAASVALTGAALAALALATVAAVVRRSAWGFAGAWFFCLLAPSSSVVPLLAQPIAEHRMYLPLASLVGAGVVVLARLGGRRALLPVALAGLALAAIAARRNLDYRSAEAIWRDTIAKQPGNARAYYQFAHAREASGDTSAAIASLRLALERHPDYAEAHAALGRLLGQGGQPAEAIPHLEAAARLKPRLIAARKNLGLCLSLAARNHEAIAVLQDVAAETPDDADAHAWLGDALVRAGQPAAALPHYATAARLQPLADKTATNWGAACLLLGREAEAAVHLSRAVELNPRSIEARRNLALTLAQLGRWPEARTQFETVLRLAPADPIAREGLRVLDARR